MIDIKRKYLFNIKRNDYLYLRVRWNHNDVFISTGYQVNKEYWDGQHCTRNSTHGPQKTSFAVINRHIESVIDKIENIFYGFEMENCIPSKPEFLEKFRGKKIEDSMTLEAAWNTFIREGVNLKQWSNNTVKSIKQIKNLLCKTHPNLTLKGINAEVLTQFVTKQHTLKLSQSNSKSKQKGYANNVIAKNCNVLKRFLKWCSDRDLISSDIVSKWKPKIKKIDKQVIYLTWEELMKFYNLDLSNEKNAREVRDIFCFMCFTSLRYSDAISLKKSQIHGDIITLATQKTSSNIVIELNKYSKEILNRYMKNGNKQVFPSHTCYTMNHYLKAIGKKLKINEPIEISQYYGSERISVTKPKYQLLSTHCGRRTFVCNALAMGIPPHVVIKWTGHKDLAAMKPYMEVADLIRRNEMKKFNNR